MKRLILIITILLAMCGVAWGDISSGLVGYWPLNQNFMQNATTVSDIGSGANNGTVVDAVVGVDGTTFDGVDQYVDLGTASNLILGTDDVSVSLWVKFGSVSGTQRLLCRYIDGNNAFRVEYRESEGQLYFIGYSNYPVNGNWVWLRYAFSPQIGTWYHIVFTYDFNTDGHCYLDNVDLTPFSEAFGNYSLSLNTNLNIGKYSSDYFTGQISDVRIYDRALTPSDVAELYALGRSSQLGDVQGVSISGVSVN